MYSSHVKIYNLSNPKTVNIITTDTYLIYTFQLPLPIQWTSTGKPKVPKSGRFVPIIYVETLQQYSNVNLNYIISRQYNSHELFITNNTENNHFRYKL